jgi:hypothetical protein
VQEKSFRSPCLTADAGRKLRFASYDQALQFIDRRRLAGCGNRRPFRLLDGRWPVIYIALASECVPISLKSGSFSHFWAHLSRDQAAAFSKLRIRTRL